MFSLQTIWVVFALAIGVAGTWGALKIQHQTEVTESYERGVTSGKAESATAAVTAATKTAQAEREATEATPLPADKAAIIALCKARASCRERGSIK